MTDDLTRNDGEAVVNSGEVSLSGESGSSVLLGQAVAPIEVAAPGAGETVNVTLTKGQSANLNFDAAAATPVIEGNNFVLTFDSNGDGSADSRIVFLNLIEESQGADAPVLVIGGIELSAALLIGQAQALVEGDTLETAAGAGAGPQGGGGSAYSDDVGQSIGLLQAQGTLGATELGFGTPTGGDDIDPGLFTLIVDFQTEIAGTEIDGQLFSGGFEDWDHRQDDCEDGHSPMEILVSFTGGELGFLTIAGIPDDALFFIGNPVGPDGQYNAADAATVVGGSITITPLQLAEGIFLLPPENSDVDIALTFTATATTTEGTPVTVVVEATAIIDAVVDQAELNIGGQGGEGGDFVVAWDLGGEGGEGGVSVNDAGAQWGAEVVDYQTDDTPDPSVESLANGGYVVLWNDGNSYSEGPSLLGGSGGPGSQGGIRAQVYGADGEERGDAILVNDEGDYPDIAAQADGGFVAVWRSGADDELEFRIFGYGEEPGAVKTLDLSGIDGVEHIGEPSITTLADGGFVITWSMQTLTFVPAPEGSESSGSYVFNEDIYIQRFDVEGNPTTDIVQIETPESDLTPDVSALPDGGYILVWNNGGRGETEGDQFNDVQVRRYDADNNLVFETVLSVPGTEYDEVPEVAGLNNGGFVVVFEAEGGKNAEVVVRVFDNTNTEVTDFTLEMPDDNFDANPHVSSLADGGFVVTWVLQEGYSVPGDETEPNSDTLSLSKSGQYFSPGIYAQRFDSSGNAVDEVPQRISGHRGDELDDPHVDDLDCDDNSVVKVFGEDNESNYDGPPSFSGQDGGNSGQLYNLSFDAAIGDDRDGSEELTLVKIGLVDQLLGEVEPNGGEGAEGDPRTFGLASAEGGEEGVFATNAEDIPDQGEAFLVVGGNQVSDGEPISVWAIWAQLDDSGNVVLDLDGKPVLNSGLVTTTATIVDGELSLDFVTGNEGIRVWEIYLDGSTPVHTNTGEDAPYIDPETGEPLTDVSGNLIEPEGLGTALEIQLPEHADDDFDVNYSVTTRDNPTDGELLDVTDGDLNNNETTVTGTLQVAIEAIADGTVLSGRDYTGDDGLKDAHVDLGGDLHLTFFEDGQSSIDKQGAGADETPLIVQVRINGDLIDKDGSEAIVKIVLDKGASDGEWVDTTKALNSDGEAFSITDYLENNSHYHMQIDGFDARVTINHSGDLVLSFSDDADAEQIAQNINITDEIGIQLPIDDSTNFNIEVTYTSAEVNAEGEVGQYNEHDSITIIVDIDGVVGAARIEQESFDTEDGYGGLSNLGFTFDGSGPQTFRESDTSDGQFDSSDPEVLGRDMFFFNDVDNQGEIIITGNVGRNPSGNTTTRDSFKVDLEEGETLTVNLNDNGASQHLMVKMIGESGFSYDEATNTLTFTAPAAGTYEWTIYNPVQGSSYTAEVSIAPGIPTYVFAEDGDPDVANQGADTGPLVIAANFNLHTEDGAGQDTNTPDPSTDSENSEAITNVELTLTGAPAGAEFILNSGTYVDHVVVGDEVITIDGAGYNVTLSGDVLTLDLVDSTGGAQNIDLGDIVSVRLPQHSDEDFSMTVVVETTEYDDDGGASQTTTATDSMNIVIDAVADGPEFTVQADDQSDPAAGQSDVDEEGTITIPVEVTFDDNDGSETHMVILSDIPSDWIPNFGGLVYTVTGLGDGVDPSTYDGPNTTYSITIDVSGLGDSDGLVDFDLSFDPQDWTSSRWSNGEAHDGGDAVIGMKATTQETNTPAPDVEEDGGNNDAEATTTHTVHITEDAPELTDQALSIVVDESADETTPDEDSANQSIQVEAGPVIDAQYLISGGISLLNLTIPGGRFPMSEGLKVITDAIDMKTDGTDDNHGVASSLESIQFATDVAGTAYNGAYSGFETTDGTFITLYSYPGHENVVYGLFNVTFDEGNNLTGGTVAFAVTIDSALENGDNDLQVYMAQYVSIYHSDEGEVHDEQVSSSLNFIVIDDEGDVSPLGHLTISFEDDGPVVIKANNAEILLDDDALGGNPGGTDDVDPDSANLTGTLDFSAGADGVKSVLLTSVGFNTNVNLSARYSTDGTETTFVQSGIDIFRIALLDTTSGRYEITQLNPLRHPEGEAEKSFKFYIYYQVTDGDGDTANGRIELSINDDTPIAVADTGDVDEGGILEVLVADGVLENDAFGADGPGNVKITGVASVGGTLAALGAPIDTVFGELTLHSDGSYDYVAKEDVTDTDVVDLFTYEITDGDGDTSTATLSINVTAGGTDDVLLFAPGIALDGGDGFDTLIIPSAGSLTSYLIEYGPPLVPLGPDRVHLEVTLINNIEAIDLTNGNPENFGALGGFDGILGRDDVIEMTDDNNVLRILGDTNDSVHIGDGLLGPNPKEWTLQPGQITENGVTYNQYTGIGFFDVTATLLVDEDMTVILY